MGMPSSAEIKRALKKIEKMESTLAPPANPTPLEKFRFDLQQKFVQYYLKTKCTQREFAKVLEVDEGKISKILNNRLEDFSTDRLINLYGKVNPELKLKVG